MQTKMLYFIQNPSYAELGIKSKMVVTFLSRFSIFCWPYWASNKDLAGPFGPINDLCMQGSLAIPIEPAKRERERERERERGREREKNFTF